MTRYWPELEMCVALAALTWVPLAQVLDHQFVNFDDPLYVTQNMDVQGGFTHDSVWWALTENRRSSHWHPLTWMSLLLDYDWYGLDPRGYHLTNLLLHTANVLLLFGVLRWTTGTLWRSAIVAGLFAVHPLHVESVAWISERKDVLSTFFWLLTTLAYFSYARRLQRDRYWLVLISYGLGLMAKPMLVTLPCTLFLLDYWPLARWTGAGTPGRFAPVTRKRLILEKIPLFVMALAASAVTLLSMGGKGTLRSLERVPLSERLGNALVAAAEYLRKMVWPSDLAAYYPLSPHGPAPVHVAVAACLLGTITLGALLTARRRPYLLVGWLWYLGTLVPVSGLVQVGSQAMADRYTYVPLVGIFIVLVWGSWELVPVLWRRRVLVPAWILALGACMAATSHQATTWHDSVSLWEHTVEVTSDNFLARTNLAMALTEQGRGEEAIGQFEKALAILPDYPRAYINLANAYRNSGRPQDAVGTYRALVRRWPEDADYRYYLAGALRAAGEEEAATREEAEEERLSQAKKRS